MGIQLVVSTVLPTSGAIFELHGFEDAQTSESHLALTLGDVNDGNEVLCRVHSECLTGDVLGSLRCDCGPQLEAALEIITKEGRGVLLYLRQEGRGIGLINKLRAYALQDKGADTIEANQFLGFDADMRSFDCCGSMLHQLGVHTVALMTNNPDKVRSLMQSGINVSRRVPLHGNSNRHNYRYLETKATRMGHLLDIHEKSKRPQSK